MLTERQVVVSLSYGVKRVDWGDVFIATIPAFGLAGYGRNEDEAIAKSKLLFNRLITGCREEGLLEDVLNRAEIEWWWEGEQPAHMTYENTSATVFGPVFGPSDFMAAAIDDTTAELLKRDPDREFAVAA